MKSPRECKDRFEDVAAFVMGELEPAAARELQDHLAGCGKCREVCDSLMEEEKEIQSGFATLASSLGTAELTALDKLQRRQRRKTQWLWPCATAVSLLLAITSSGILFMQGTATGEKIAAYFKSEKTHKSETIPQVLWYPDARKAANEIRQLRPHPSPRRDNSTMDYLTLNRLMAEKGVGALPGPLWIPMGQEKYPRHSLVIQDEWKMF